MLNFNLNLNLFFLVLQLNQFIMPLARAIALNIIKSFVPLNLPGSAIIHYLQELNVAYRRVDMLADIRAAYGRIKYETQVAGLRSDQVVHEGWMSREEMAAPYNYRVHLKVDYYDPDTDTYSTEHRYMFADEASSVGDYAEQFPDYAMSKEYVQDRDYVGVSVIGVTKNMREGVPF